MSFDLKELICQSAPVLGLLICLMASSAPVRSQPLVEPASPSTTLLRPPLRVDANSAPVDTIVGRRAADDIKESAILDPLPVLSLSASFDQGLLNSPRMAGARALLGLAKSAYAQALTFPNPGIYLSNAYQNNSFIGASIPIEPPWKVAFRLLVVKKQLEQTRLEIQRTLWSYRGEVRRNYAQVAISQQSLETRKELLELSVRIVSATQKLYDNGNVPRLDIRRARVAQIQAKMDLHQAEITLSQAKEQLNLSLGLPASAPFKVPPIAHKKAQDQQQKQEGGTAEKSKDGIRETLLPKSEFSANPDDLIARALNSRLELKIAKQALEVNRANLLNAYGNVVPNPRFVVGHGRELNPVTGPIQNIPFLQAYIDVPLLNWQQGDIARFKASKTTLSLDLASQENTIRSQVSLAYHKVKAARTRIDDFLNDALPETEEVSKIAQHGYELGQTDLNTLLDSQRAYVSLQMQFFDAVLAYQLALNDLEQSVGEPVEL